MSDEWLVGTASLEEEMAVTFRWKRPVSLSDGRRVLPDFRQLRMQLRASWVNKRWISAEELEEIRRGN